MDRKMKKVAAAILCVFALMSVTAAVYAYLQDAIERTNRIVIGEGKVKVDETFTTPPSLQMSNTFVKVVTVKNTGTSDQYVRTFLDFSDSSVRDRSKIIYTKTKNGTPKEAAWGAFLNDLPDDWIYVGNGDTDSAVLGGYFYYKKSLAPGESTPPLITGIKTDYETAVPPSGQTANVDKITDFDVFVYSESVQTVETKTGTVYDSATDDNAWRNAWKSFLSRNP